MRWLFGIGKAKGTVARIHFTFLIFLARIVLAANATHGGKAALVAATQRG